MEGLQGDGFAAQTQLLPLTHLSCRHPSKWTTHGNVSSEYLFAMYAGKLDLDLGTHMAQKSHDIQFLMTHKQHDKADSVLRQQEMMVLPGQHLCIVLLPGDW